MGYFVSFLHRHEVDSAEPITFFLSKPTTRDTSQAKDAVCPGYLVGFLVALPISLTKKGQLVFIVLY